MGTPSPTKDSALEIDENDSSILMVSSTGSSDSKGGSSRPKSTPLMLKSPGRLKLPLKGPFEGRLGLSTLLFSTVCAGSLTNPSSKDNVARQKDFGVIVVILGGIAVKVMVPGTVG
jgi:hypothetical protein